MITVSQGTSATPNTTTASNAATQSTTTTATAATSGNKTYTAAVTSADLSAASSSGANFSDVFDSVTAKSGQYKPAYVYVTPDGQVFDVGKDQGDQMEKNAVSQGYDATVNGRLTPYAANSAGQIEINGVQFDKASGGRYDTFNRSSPLAVVGNSMPGAKAITGKADNTAIDLSIGDNTEAENAVAKLKSMGVTNYRVETIDDATKDKISKTADYYKQNNYSVSSMLQNLNPLKYSVDPVAILAYKGDAFKLDTSQTDSSDTGK